MPQNRFDLPIHQVADALCSGLRTQGRVVLSAPTGSGKSTQVPQILLDAGLVEGEIVVLQPRRLAARLLAKRVAHERGVQLGEEVGYQIRFENVVSSATRIRFVTEAILLRQILQDPELSGVGAILFDEFHERHLSSDLSLAAALQTLQSLRPELKIVVMSATLDIEQLEAYLQPCARVEATGRLYPVEVSYGGAALGRNAAPVWERAAQALRKQLRAADEGALGEVLIFMPGAFEIRKTIDAVQALPEARGFDVLPLHGELAPEAQDRAVSRGARPKIIVATNVAETSITIDGVRLVIDGGLARVARYDSRRGINSLLVEPISRAAAQQRTGRAGRTGPGHCIRLWSEAEHAGRQEQDSAEIARVDLAETVLMLAAHDIKDLEHFPWFESPAAGALERARILLQDLGAFDVHGALTDLGRQMGRMPLHPRYARLLIEGARRGVLEQATLVCALSQGRAVYRAAREERIRREQIRQIEDQVDERSDFFVQLRAWDFAQGVRFDVRSCMDLGIHAGAARQAGEVARQLFRMGKQTFGDRVVETIGSKDEALLRCILSAFSDHLCRRNDRGTRRCKMVHARAGELRRESLVESELFVAAEIEERELRGEVTVLLGLATAVELSWLEELSPEAFRSGAEAVYDSRNRRVEFREAQSYRDLVLKSVDRGEPDLDQAADLLAEEVVAGRLVLKQWNSVVENWIQRVNFVARHCPETEIAPIDAEARHLLIEQICHGAVSYKEIKDRSVLSVVKEWIAPEQHYYVDTYAPEEVVLPRRKRPVRVRYEADGRAFIASKLQDFYDVSGASLRLGNDQVAPLIELLAPNGRPAHLTDDLDGFWAGAYQHVRKDLAGRYPKHEWR